MARKLPTRWTGRIAVASLTANLKPGNVMLTATGAKLLDFGLAKLAAQDIGGAAPSAVATQATPVTAAGTIIGTFDTCRPNKSREKSRRFEATSFRLVLFFTKCSRGSQPFLERASSA